MTLYDLQQNLKGFDIRAEVTSVLESTSEDLAELNRGQLFLGMKSDGGFLPDYSPVSVAKFGKPAGPIRLYDTGKFWGAIKVEVDSSGIKFSDTDIKYATLFKRYGKDILGLDAEVKNAEYIPNYFLPALMEKIHAKLGI